MPLNQKPNLNGKNEQINKNNLQTWLRNKISPRNYERIISQGPVYVYNKNRPRSNRVRTPVTPLRSLSD